MKPTFNPYFVSSLKKEEFPLMYIADLVGSVVGILIGGVLPFVIGMKYTLFVGVGILVLLMAINEVKV